MTDHLMACFQGSFQAPVNPEEKQTDQLPSVSVGGPQCDLQPVKPKAAVASGWIAAPSKGTSAGPKTPTAKRKIPESDDGFDCKIPTKRGKAFWREKQKEKSNKYRGRINPTVINFTSSEDEEDLAHSKPSTSNQPVVKTKQKAVRRYKRTKNGKD